MDIEPSTFTSVHLMEGIGGPSAGLWIYGWMNDTNLSKEIMKRLFPHTSKDNSHWNLKSLNVTFSENYGRT